MPKMIALLRGVNVGGKNRLPMAVLAALFEKAGCTNVVTYIQSGNVVFDVAAARARNLAAGVESAIERTFGFRSVVVTRTAEEIANVIASNPFLKKGVAVETLHVSFLSRRPTAAEVATLDAQRSAPDAFVVKGAEIYLQLPNGAARTKLTNAYFDSKLSATSTMRNWRTVLQLHALAT